MTTIAAVGNVLRSQLGVVERRENLTAYGEWYSPDGEAWCGKFVSWGFDQVDALDAIHGRFKYTPAGAAAFQKADAWGRTPKVGSLVFFHWASMGRIAHVGWVEALVPGGFISIEGNTDVAGGRTGGRVLRQKRSSGSIGKLGGFGMPVYDGAGTAVSVPSGVGIPRCPGVSREGMGRKGAPDPVVAAYQQRFKDRGWSVVVDGIHREGFSRVILAFQKEKGLTLDRGTPAAGPQVWGALWTTPVTR